MPDAPKMPAIPLPRKDDLDARFETIMALKMAVEMLIGTRGGNPVARVFVQNDQPTAFNTGDIWVVRDTGKTSYWDGSKWLLTT